MYAAVNSASKRDVGADQLPTPRIVFFFILLLLRPAAVAAPILHTGHQQAEAFFLSSSDPGPRDVLLRLAKNTPRPTYGGFLSIVGTGAIGGSPVDLREVGHSEDELPAASAVPYWEDSPSELYQWKILGLSAALMIETLLIIVLLRSRSRRKEAEEALRSKEEELLEVQRVAQLSSWQRDLRTDAIIWSNGLFDLTGFYPDVPLRSFKQLSHFFTPKSWERLTESMEEIRRSGKCYEVELDARRADGARIWVVIREAVVRDRAGSMVRVRGTMQNITERKANQLARLKHAAIVESSDDAIVSKDLDGLIVSWNSGAERIFGYTEPEVMGVPVTILIPPELHDEERMISERVKAGERIEHHEAVRIGKRGKKIYVSLTMSPVKDSTGRIIGISQISRDITQSKQSQQALVESEKRFRLMADSAPVLMWLSGPDKLYTDFNKAWLKFSGKTTQEELGEGWRLSVHPDDLQAYLQVYDRAFDARESFELEYRMRRHDGQYRWILNHGVPRFTEDGSFAGYIGCCVDITDQKEAKTALRELSGRLVHAQEEERARIAGELHDDISQRLALLANGLQELEQAHPMLDESQRVKQLSDLQRLTNEIAADLQHLSHRLHPSKLRYLGLAAAVRELCKEFSRQHKIQVDCIVRDVPRHLEESVALSLFRTAQESLHNAAKHSHAHYIKVEVAGAPNSVRLRVSDDGVGFDPDHMGDSHGLGLVSMRERLRLVGGDFSIWSRPSLGTQVEATVPVHVRSAQTA